MYTLLAQTRDFALQEAQKELTTFLTKEFNVVDEEVLRYDYEDFDELFSDLSQFYYYFEFFDRVYLKIAEVSKGEVSLLPLEYINLENYAFCLDEQIPKQLLSQLSSLLSIDETSSSELILEQDGFYIDLFGFDINEKVELEEEFRREESFVYAKAFSKLQSGHKSFIDPFGARGDLLFDLFSFTTRPPRHVKQRRLLPIAKLTSKAFPLPKKTPVDKKFKLIVQEDLDFKKAREQLTLMGSPKISMSEFDLDWLDVKFYKNDFDCCVCFFPEIEDNEEEREFQKEFFYQAEFITKSEILVFSYKSINEKFLKEFNLELKLHEKIAIDEEEKLHYYLISVPESEQQGGEEQ